jgi:hypothetical protein
VFAVAEVPDGEVEVGSPDVCDPAVAVSEAPFHVSEHGSYLGVVQGHDPFEDGDGP